MSPLFSAGTHLAQYEYGLSELLNFVVLPSGAITRRPPTKRLHRFDINGHLVRRLFVFHLPDDDVELFIFEERNLSIYTSAMELKQTHQTIFSSGVLETLSVVQSMKSVYIAHADEVMTVLNRSAEGEWSAPVGLGAPQFGALGTASEKERKKYYPSHLIFFQNRLWAFSSRHQITTIWATGVNQYDVTEKQTVIFQPGKKEDEAFSFTYVSGIPSPTQWVVAGKQIVFGTKYGEYVITPIDNTRALSVNNIKVRQETSTGSVNVVPIQLGGECFFIHSSGRRLETFSYGQENDSYHTVNVSFFSEHLLESGVKRIIHQHHPYSIFWIVCQDGSLVSLTYNREQKVAGWARHRIGGGRVKDVVLVKNTERDRVFFLIEREQSGENGENGQSEWTIEELNPFRFSDSFEAEEVHLDGYCEERDVYQINVKGDAVFASGQYYDYRDQLTHGQVVSFNQKMSWSN